MPKFSCQKVNYTFPMEDFVKVDDNTLIAGGANTDDMLNFNPNKKRDKGTLVLFDIRKKQLKNLELKNFPKNLHFYPHGMELYKNKYIYVINHGFNSIDGERFEIFEIVKEKNEVKYLNYIRSIKLPEEFHTATNGLAMAGEDDIFFTKCFPVHLPAIDKSNFFNKIYFYSVTIFNFIFNLKLSNLYHYKNGIITKVKDSQSTFNNGATYDPVNRFIFLVHTIDNNIRVFKYEENGEIKFIRDIYLGYKIDNVIFDEKKRILNAGIMGLGGYGGLAEIYPDKNFEIKFPFYDKINSMASSGIQIDKKIYLVSPLVKYLLYCEN